MLVGKDSGRRTDGDGFVWKARLFIPSPFQFRRHDSSLAPTDGLKFKPTLSEASTLALDMKRPTAVDNNSREPCLSLV